MCRRKTRKVWRKDWKVKAFHFCYWVREREAQTSNGKVLATCFARDFFYRLLCFSLQRQIDMNEVLFYSLNPVPLSLSHVDGSMQNTPKSKLMKYVESLAATDLPKTVDGCIIDVIIFLRLYLSLTTIFDWVARYLLARVSEFEGHKLHFVFNKWVHPFHPSRIVKEVNINILCERTCTKKDQLTG